jgi:hypothetical protein
MRFEILHCKRASKKNGSTIVKGAFRVVRKDDAGWSMGESVGMRSDTSRAGPLRVAELAR